jgi:hypothetical protein
MFISLCSQSTMLFYIIHDYWLWWYWLATLNYFHDTWGSLVCICVFFPVSRHQLASSALEYMYLNTAMLYWLCHSVALYGCSGVLGRCLTPMRWIQTHTLSLSECHAVSNKLGCRTPFLYTNFCQYWCIAWLVYLIKLSNDWNSLMHTCCAKLLPVFNYVKEVKKFVKLVILAPKEWTWL